MDLFSSPSSGDKLLAEKDLKELEKELIKAGSRLLLAEISC